MNYLLTMNIITFNSCCFLNHAAKLRHFNEKYFLICFAFFCYLSTTPLCSNLQSVWNIAIGNFFRQRTPRCCSCCSVAVLERQFQNPENTSIFIYIIIYINIDINLNLCIIWFWTATLQQLQRIVKDKMKIEIIAPVKGMPRTGCPNVIYDPCECFASIKGMLP